MSTKKEASKAKGKETAPVAAPKDKVEEVPTRVRHEREVKTKEYREAHKVSWGVHTHHRAKDPNRYYALCLSALVQLRSENRNATLPRILEIVKSKVTAGAFSVRSKVRAAIQKMLNSGRAQVTARGVISLKSRRTTKKSTTSTKGKSRKTAKKTTRKTATKKTAAKKKTTKRKAASKRSGKAVEEVVEESPAPAAKKARKGKASADDKYIWEYKERDNWFPYAPEASDIVEAAYQDYLNDPNQVDVRSVKSGMWAYQVDFTNMTQTNIQHENHTVRDIRRTLVQE